MCVLTKGSVTGGVLTIKEKPQIKGKGCRVLHAMPKATPSCGELTLCTQMATGRLDLAICVAVIFLLLVWFEAQGWETQSRAAGTPTVLMRTAMCVLFYNVCLLPWLFEGAGFSLLSGNRKAGDSPLKR